MQPVIFLSKQAKGGSADLFEILCVQYMVDIIRYW